MAKVLDVDTLESGSPYMVMEYLAGCDLRATLARVGRMTVEDATGSVLQACDALAEAHAIGIVHRDLKPANLFIAVRRDGARVVKILDFGIFSSLRPSKQTPLSRLKKRDTRQVVEIL